MIIMKLVLANTSVSESVSLSDTRLLCLRLQLSLSGECRCGTTGDFAISFLHFSLFSTALWDLANSRPVHSPMLSSHLFFRLLYPLPPFTVPCKMILAISDEQWAVGRSFGPLLEGIRRYLPPPVYQLGKTAGVNTAPPGGCSKTKRLAEFFGNFKKQPP